MVGETDPGRGKSNGTEYLSDDGIRLREKGKALAFNLHLQSLPLVSY